MQEYRIYTVVQETLGLCRRTFGARTARTDRERRIFLQMTWAWLEIAIRLESVSNSSAQASELTIQ
jgi:hypothetical protein